MSYGGGQNQPLPESTPGTWRTDDFQFNTSLGQSFIRQNHCDVHFQLGDQSIGAHVAVLIARSPVFAAMFQHDMQETKTRQVIIADIEPAVFKQLLHYIYSGRAPDLRLDQMAQSLLLAADKYDIADLKEECLALLRSRITVDNAINTLMWAHYHSMTRLAEAALAFVAQHGQESCTSRSDQVDKNCPQLSDLIATQEEMMINNPSLCSC